MTYSDKLKDPRWQKRRLEIFSRDDFKCRCCGSAEKTLHLHHQYYIKGHEPWDYSDCMLLTLCHDCHLSEESWKSSDGDFMETMLQFELTRSEINSFVSALWNHLFYKHDKRKALLELCEILYKNTSKDG